MLRLKRLGKPSHAVWFILYVCMCIYIYTYIYTVYIYIYTQQSSPDHDPSSQTWLKGYLAEALIFAGKNPWFLAEFAFNHPLIPDNAEGHVSHGMMNQGIE